MSQQGPISVAVYGRTDVGLIREHNEDNFLIADLGRDVRTNEVTEPLSLDLHTKGALFIVCDGMGGAAAGEVASLMAVDAISSAMAALTLPSSHTLPPAERETGDVKDRQNAAVSVASTAAPPMLGSARTVSVPRGVAARPLPCVTISGNSSVMPCSMRPLTSNSRLSRTPDAR